MSDPVGAPAICVKCDVMFATGIIADASLGNRVRCPTCGAWCNVADSLWDDDANEMKLVYPDEELLRAYETLQEVVRKARSNEIEQHEVLAAVAGIDPELARKIEPLLNGKLWLVALLVFLLVRAIEVNITIDVNRAIDQFEQWGEDRTLEELEDPESALEKFGTRKKAPPVPKGESRWTRAGGQGSGQPSRQVRRQQERRARKTTRQRGQRD